MAKRYYWLKLKEDFFRAKEIKKLRRIAGGDTYTVIYLKMMLLSLQHEGRLYFDGLEDSFVEELALELDESDENVAVTVSFLERYGLLEFVQDDVHDAHQLSTTNVQGVHTNAQNCAQKCAILAQAAEAIGSECESAERVRRVRNREKQEQTIQPLQCNAQPLHCAQDIDIELEIENRDIKNICASDDARAHEPPETSAQEKAAATRKEHEAAASAMFERLWEEYPRKRGKGRVSMSQKLKLYKIGEAAIAEALRRYKASVAGSEVCYIQHGSTWFNSGYIDYLGDNYKPETRPVQKQSSGKNRYKYESAEGARDFSFMEG